MRTPARGITSPGPPRRSEVVTSDRLAVGLILSIALGIASCNRHEADDSSADHAIDYIHDWCDGSEACNANAFSAQFTSHSACVAIQQDQARTYAAFYADYGPDCNAAHAAATRCTLDSATCRNEAGTEQFVANIDSCAAAFETFAAACNRQ